MNIYDLNGFKAISIPIAHAPHNIASLYITRVGTRKYNQLVQGYVMFCSYTAEYPEKTSKKLRLLVHPIEATLAYKPCALYFYIFI